MHRFYGLCAPTHIDKVPLCRYRANSRTGILVSMEHSRKRPPLAPIETVCADTLLELLNSHSDLDTSSVATLACTSKNFRDAADRTWPLLMEAYEQKRQRNAVAKPCRYLNRCVDITRIQEDCEYFEEATCSGKPRVTFVVRPLMTEEERGAALVPVSTARRTFFMATPDLQTLQPYRDVHGMKLFRFRDVIEAAMLRYGRREMLEKMLTFARKRDRARNARAARWQEVQEIARSTIAEGDWPCGHELLKIAEDYLKKGRGGLQVVRDRCKRFHLFLALVSQGAWSWPGPIHLQPSEKAMVGHLHVGYCLTGDIRFVYDAIKTVRDRRAMSSI